MALVKLTPEQELILVNTEYKQLTQRMRVLKYLISYHNDFVMLGFSTMYKLTPIFAWSTLGVYRLSSVIFILRRAGYSIHDDGDNVTDRYGEKCSVAAYRLVRS